MGIYSSLHCKFMSMLSLLWFEVALKQQLRKGKKKMGLMTASRVKPSNVMLTR